MPSSATQPGEFTRKVITQSLSPTRDDIIHSTSPAHCLCREETDEESWSLTGPGTAVVTALAVVERRVINLPHYHMVRAHVLLI